MNSFFETLKGIEKVMYKASYNFHMNHCKEATIDTAHQAGLNELKRLGKLREEHSQPGTWVDQSTGKTFNATI